MRTNRFIQILILFSTIMSSFVPASMVSADLSNPGVLTKHNSITISSNSDFTAANGVVAGSGTMAKPYIFENWSIEVKGWAGVDIRNTNKYFTFRNCLIHNATKTKSTFIGFYILNVTKGSFLNNRIEWLSQGMRTQKVSQMTIKDNLIRDTDYGLYLTTDSNSNTIDSNVIYNSSNTGIFMGETTDNTLQGNTVSNSTLNINIGGTLQKHYYHIITTTNTVEGKTVYYWTGQANKAVPSNAGMIGLINCSKIDITGQDISKAGKGILLINTDNSTISGNTVNRSFEGLFSIGSDNITIHDNKFHNNSAQAILLYLLNNDFDIYLNNITRNKGVITFNGLNYNNDIYNNTFRDNIGFAEGLYLGGSAKNNRIFSNFLKNNTDGIFMDWGAKYNKIYNNTLIGDPILLNNDANNATINNNTLEKGRIDNFYGDDTKIFDNVVRNSTTNGIRLYGVLKNKVFNNKVSGSKKDGIIVDSVSGYSDIYNNMVSNSSLSGISVQNSGWINVYGNTIFKNSVGINDSSYSDHGDIYSNRVYQNNIGLSFVDSKRHAIYNNFFNNTKQYYLKNSGPLTWNISKISGTNIVGGPYRAGNYWSDYIGSDTNGDSLGDTNLPFGPGDQKPLMYPDHIKPGIMDGTISIPTTGDNFTFKASSWDNIRVQNVSIKYWTNVTVKVNTTMNLSTGNHLSGTYNLTFKVPSNAIFLWYFVMANDTSSNWNFTSTKKVQVVDNDAPKITDKTLVPTTGDNMTFKIKVDDNINVSGVHAEYWFNWTAHTNISLTPSGGYYVANISIPSNATKITYTLSANDNSSNWGIQANIVKGVADNDKPQIVDNTKGTPTTGEEFPFNLTVTDNLNVSSVVLEYWFNNGEHQNITVNMTAGFYMINITVDTYATNMTYIIYASDGTKNWNETTEKVIQVVDNDLPTIVDLTMVPTTGDVFNFTADVMDNVRIKEVRVEYWFDLGNHLNESMLWTGTAIRTINVPADARVLRYILSATDTSNNTLVLPMVKVSVVDNDAPVVQIMFGTPKTGLSYDFGFTVVENRDPGQATLEYWFDTGSHITVDFKGAGTFNHSIDVPASARKLYYILKAKDLSDNMVLVTKNLTVMDVIKPNITDLTPVPTTGESITILLNITDNWEVASTSIEYWFDDGPHTIKNYISGIKVAVPSNALMMHINTTAKDSSGNNQVLLEDRPVNDNDLPIITDSSKNATTGDVFKFDIAINDNVGVTEAYVVYRFDSLPEVNLTFNEGLTVIVPANARSFHYIIRAMDKAKNIAERTREIKVIDNDKPQIESPLLDPRTYETCSINITVLDNIEVQKVEFQYSFNDGGPMTKTMIKALNVYSIDVLPPMDARTMTFTVTAWDISDNTNSIQSKTVVKDTIKPEIADSSGIPKTREIFILASSTKDNIAIQKASIEYWYDNSSHTTVNHMKEVALTVPDSARQIHYIIKATDTSGNEKLLEKVTDVVDTHPPTLEVLVNGTPSAGQKFTFKARASDNIGIKKVFLEYGYGDERSQKEMAFDNVEGVYSTDLTIKDKDKLTFSIIAVDEAGNSEASPEKSLSIAHPLGMMAIFSVMGLVILIVVVLIGLLIKRKKRNEKGKA